MEIKRPMRLVDFRLHRIARRLLYVSVAMAWLSGLSFYVIRRWFQIEDDFGPQAHPWQHLILSVHGSAAMLMLMWIGAIAFSHIPMTWRTNRSRSHGILLASAAAVMVLAAWCLYYLSDESWRALVANVHFWLGLGLPVLLALHIYLGRRHARASGEVR
jgi:hypothetical protein